MSIQAPSLPALEDDDGIDYPESDGQPMAEGDAPRKLMVDTIETLETHFAARPDVYVSGNISLYYEKGNPKRCVAPDVLVAFGVEKRERGTYKVWQESKVPDVMMELASLSPGRNDVFRKVTLYCGLGVQEFVLLGEWFRESRLLLLRRDGDSFVNVEPDERGRLHSEVLGLELAAEGERLSLYDPATGATLRTPREQAAAAQEQATAAQAEARREAELRQSAEQRLRELEAELRRLQGAG